MLANGYMNGGLASNATSPAHGYDPSAALVGKFAVAGENEASALKEFVNTNGCVTDKP